ncbi:class I SAM-dependent methyltransferase [Magnetococcales bacterium HHB-1]
MSLNKAAIFLLIKKCLYPLYLWERQRQIKAHYQTESINKLHFGCGDKKWAGWINADYFQRPFSGSIHLNAFDIPFPMPSESLDYVFSEHVHEHFDYQSGLRIAQEFIRLLKPGGVFRCSVPCFDRLTALAEKAKEMPEDPEIQTIVNFVFNHQSSTDFLQDCDPHPVAAVNSFFYCHEHRFIYNFDILSKQLKKAGFSKVYPCKIGQSAFSELQDREYGKKEPGGYETYMATTLTLEAIK